MVLADGLALARASFFIALYGINSIRILMLEDDQDIAQSMAWVLNQSGHETCHVTNGHAVLAHWLSWAELPTLHSWSDRHELSPITEHFSTEHLVRGCDGADKSQDG
jgi:hypothetical protein